MISFSIWHCDYCLGDICCCIKSNVPFLSFIASTWELFSLFFFLKKQVETISRNTQQSSTAHPSALCALQEHPDANPPMVLALCKTFAAFTVGQKASALHLNLHVHDVALLCVTAGPPTLPILMAQLFSFSSWHPVVGIISTAYSWVSVPAGMCCRNAPSKQNTLLSCRQVKRPFSRWLHLRADGGFRLCIKRLILWGADLNQGWGQHSAPCKDKIQKLKAATGGREGEGRE